jgi:hypothetical protein
MKRPYVVRVTRTQLVQIRAITDQWDSSSRWLPELDLYLWEEDIRPTPESVPADPNSYRFLAGGVDHINETSRSITVVDRGLQTNNQTVDGTTKFVAI